MTIDQFKSKSRVEMSIKPNSTSYNHSVSIFLVNEKNYNWKVKNYIHLQTSLTERKTNKSICF